MRSWLFRLLFVTAILGPAIAQEDKKTDDDKPADPDTGESTIEEKTRAVAKPAAEVRREVRGDLHRRNARAMFPAVSKQGAVYEGRLNLAVDIDLQKLDRGRPAYISRQHVPDPRRRTVARHSPEPVRGQRHRSAAVDTAVRGLFREAMGQQAGIAEGRPACRRQRVLQHEIHRRLHQRIDGMACDHFDRFAERRPLAAAGSDGSPRCWSTSRSNFPSLAASSMAIRPVRDRTIPSSATDMASTSGSTIRPCCWDKSSTPGTTRRAIPNSTGQIKLGGWRHFGPSRITDSHRTAFRLRRPPAAAPCSCCQATSGLGGLRAADLSRAPKRRPRHRRIRPRLRRACRPQSDRSLCRRRCRIHRPQRQTAG